MELHPEIKLEIPSILSICCAESIFVTYDLKFVNTSKCNNPLKLLNLQTQKLNEMAYILGYPYQFYIYFQLF